MRPMKNRLSFLFLSLLLVSSGAFASCGKGGATSSQEGDIEAFRYQDFLSFGAYSDFRFYQREGEDHQAFFEGLVDEFETLSHYMDTEIPYEDVSGKTTAKTLSEGEGSFLLDDTMADLLSFAIDARAITGGAINILSGGLNALWKDSYLLNKEDPSLPTESEISRETRRILSSSLSLTKRWDGDYEVTKEGDAILDFGSMGKGYAVQLLGEALRKEGIDHFLLNAGTSSILIGQNPNSEDGTFHIGFSDIEGLTFRAKDVAIGTSSVTNQHRVDEETGILYSHAIDPATGSAVPSLTTAIVIGEDAGMCDVFSTWLLMKGEGANIPLIERMGYSLLLYDYRRSDPFVHLSESFPPLEGE